MGPEVSGMDWDAPRGQVDAGHGFSYTVLYADEAHTTPIAMAEYHPCPKRRIHRAAEFSTDLDPDALARYADEHGIDGAPAILPFDVPAAADWPAGAKWTLEQVEPLTVSPSILCGQCGFHGFLRNGVWEPV